MPEPQTFAFQAEVSQVLDLVIHSLYAHKEVFLRELVSNASDALDKARFQALTAPELFADEAALEIRVAPDPAKGVLVIEDTGIGMTRDELAKHLGTIAHSGTKAFVEQLRAAGKGGEARLIGQFGVGFYSAFLVADRVEVVSRAAGASESWCWSSDAKSGFTITPAERVSRGTSITLHLKGDQKQFLEEWRLRELVRRYSDFVAYPIKLRVTKQGDSVWEAANQASALWQRPRAEITDEQHAEFYKHLSHDGDAPLARTHFTVEGTQVFTALLYVPRAAPMFEADVERRGVRLFVKRVFIMDDCRELLPPWMRFVRGVVDSDDLPLNVSRETLQDSSVVRTIRKQVTKKVLDLLDDVAKERPDDYVLFWKAWGRVVKEGLATEHEHRERLAKLLRFSTTKGDAKVPLEGYVARMPLRQQAIYWVLGESEASLAASPYIEALAKQGFEVLLLTDPIDEWAMDTLGEFDGKPLVSAMRADLDLAAPDGDEGRARAAHEKELAPLVTRAKEILGDAVSDVRVSERLTDSPCCLVVRQGEHHAFLARALREAGREVSPPKRVLEINPSHPLVTALRTLADRDPASERLTTLLELLHDQARLTEAGQVSDPNRFARRLTDLLADAAQRAVAP